MDPNAIQTLAFQVAQEEGIAPQELFKQIYLALINKEQGPRLGKLVAAIGIEKVKSLLFL